MTYIANYLKYLLNDFGRRIISNAFDSFQRFYTKGCIRIYGIYVLNSFLFSLKLVVINGNTNGSLEKLQELHHRGMNGVNIINFMFLKFRILI